MRKFGFLAGTATALAYLALSGIPAFGASTGTVSTTVDVALPEPCITIDTPSVDYGALSLREGGGVPGLDMAASDVITLHNCSERDIDVLATGSDATGSSATWTLADPKTCADSTSVNRYSHMVARTATAAGAVNLTKSAQQFYPDLMPNTSTNAVLTFYMPCKGSAGEGETMNANVTFTAMFAQ